MTYALTNVETADGSLATPPAPGTAVVVTVGGSSSGGGGGGGGAAGGVSVTNAAVPVPVFDEYDIQYVNEVVCRDYSTMSVQVFNPPTLPEDYQDCAFVKFEVYATFSPGGREILVLSSGNDYTTPRYPCTSATVDPTSLPADGECWFVMDVTAFHSVKFLIAPNSDHDRTCQISVVMKNGNSNRIIPVPLAP